MAVSGSAAIAAKFAAVSSMVRPAAAAVSMTIRPLPKSNGSAGVTRSSFTTSSVAVVISADFTCPGVQSG